MSVLIKGMEMPKENAICVVIFPGGEVTSQFGVPHLGTAVPVPPHGRLIDADALEEYFLNDPSCLTIFDAIKKLQGMPTIIPAEEGEK